MSVEFVALCFLYLLAGGCTIYTLCRNKMSVAAVVYSVAFVVLLLYLPVFTGNDLFRQAVEEEKSVFGHSEAAKSALIEAFHTATSYLSLPFFIAICISLFLCVSAISVAVTAICVVREIRRVKGIFRHVGVLMFRKNGIRSRIPKTCNFCHTFCRYNC